MDRLHGSGQETRTLIEDFQKNAPFNVIHLWHEDDGWRKPTIHNKAIAQTKTKHLIFIDGDCILAPKFVSGHKEIFAQEKDNYLFM